MKLLILTNNPERASYRQRIGMYLETLETHGIACTTAVLPAAPLARYRLFRKAREFDGVFLHKKGLNLLDAYNLRRNCRRLIYNYDDAVMYSDRRPDRVSLSHLLPFRRTARMADMIIVGSPYLAEQSRQLNANVKVLPIGLDTGDYQVKQDGSGDGKIRLVWIGSASTLDYLADLRPVLEEIGGTFDHVLLRIIGDTFFDLANMAVEKVPWRRETRARQLATADIGLGPLPSNPFTEGKCSFKILEYACSGLPVVASPVGTNGVFVQEGVTGFLAGDRKQWITRLSQLIKDPGLRTAMGQAGVARAREFDVRIIGRQLAELIAGFLAADGQ
ncbi:MAG: glycosyltransferase family 4 protein [Deltaproteobacteria bacterium]|nr:glycosyltransferase family 4 protein [Deltaproteobacteria bacterium]